MIGKMKKCFVCDKYLDKSDCQEAWVTIKRSSYFLNDVRVKAKTTLLHLQCAPMQLLNEEARMQSCKGQVFYHPECAKEPFGTCRLDRGN